MVHSGQRVREGRFTRLWKRSLLIIASSLAALGLAEVVVRVAGRDIPPRAGRPPRQIAEKVPESQVPGVGFMPKPGVTQVVVYPGGEGEPNREVVYEINRLGFRGGKYSRRNREGVFRIVVLGDSFTFGTGVSLSDTFPDLMEKRFFPAMVGAIKVEVLNWGVEAYNTAQEVALFRHRVGEFDPDLVLLVAYVNDASGEARDVDGSWQEGGVKEQSWEVRWIQRLGLTSGVIPEESVRTKRQNSMMALRERSRLADLLAYHVYGRLRGRVSVRSYQEDWREGSPGLAMVRASFEDLEQLSREHGVGVHVAMYPDLNQLDGDYPFRQAHGQVAELSREHGFRYHDLMGALEGREGSSLHAHAHDKHPNGTCNAIVAEVLARELLPWVTGERP